MGEIMDFMQGIEMTPPEVKIYTSNHGGLSTDQIVELAASKIMYVSDDAPPVIKDQAIAFRARMMNILTEYVIWHAERNVLLFPQRWKNMVTQMWLR